MSETQTSDLDAAMDELMKFTPQQRIELAERLIDSVPPYCGDPEVERAWNVEIARRIEDIEQGRVKPIPAAQAIQEARERIREIREQASGRQA